MFFKNMLLVEEEFLRNLFRLLQEYKHQQVLEQVVVLVGTIASHNPACRDLLIHSGALNSLLALVRNVCRLRISSFFFKKNLTVIPGSAHLSFEGRQLVPFSFLRRYSSTSGFA